MAVKLKSSDVQQNFGKVMERALTEEDVIVERYGQPRVAILSYRRYRELLQLEQEDGGVHLARPRLHFGFKIVGVTMIFCGSIHAIELPHQ